MNYYKLIIKFNIKTFPSIVFKFDKKYTFYTDILLPNNIYNFINQYIIKLGTLINISQTSGQSLILLTEAPHSNFIKWASPLYENKASLKTMISTGYHKPEVWYSILFQLSHIFYVLQKEEIYFEELSLENNIYIKDLYYEPNVLNFWIYIVDNIEYYIPNYGYLVVFDSKYSDCDDYKIKSSKLFPNHTTRIPSITTTTIPIDYKKLIYDKFKEVIEVSNYKNKLRKQGGLEPDSNILDFIKKLFNYSDIQFDLKGIFKENFKCFLHNKIGTLLTRNEKEIVNILNRPEFNNKPKLLVKIERYDEYKWVYYISDDTNNLLKNIITTDKNNIAIEEQVNAYSLIDYPEIILPNNIDQKNIIEYFYEN
jgi:hypothetical protein